MSRTIRLQSDSNAHDRPWRVTVEQGLFAAEGLSVEYHEDNPKGAAGRVEDFSQRWKEAPSKSIRFANAERSSAFRRSAAARLSVWIRRCALAP